MLTRMKSPKPIRDASDVRWAPAGRGEVQHVAVEQRAQPLDAFLPKIDELRAMLRARRQALLDLAPTLRRAGPDHPQRQRVNKQLRASRARLRALVASLDATIAAFIDEHHEELLKPGDDA